MANSLQQIEIGGRTIWVEVTDIESRANRPANAEFANTSNSGLGTAAEVLTKVDIRDTLQALVTPVHDALMALAPKEATVELTLGFAIKGNLFVTAGEGNASLKVTAKWAFDPKAKTPQAT